MWTDKQLLEQGWSQDQIAQYRIEQEIQATPKQLGAPETVVETQPIVTNPVV